VHMSKAGGNGKKDVNILVIKTGALGDLVLASASFTTVRNHFRGARMCLLTEPAFAQVVDGCPLFSRVFFLPRRRKNPFSLLRLVCALRREHFEIVFDLQGNLRTNVLAFLAKAPVRSGFYRAAAGALFLTHAVKKGARVNPVDGQFGPLRKIGVREFERRPTLWNKGSETGWERFCDTVGMNRAREFIVIHAVSSGRWHTRRWLPGRFAAVADSLRRRGYDIVFIGDGEGRRWTQTILRRMREPAFNLCGRTSFVELCMLVGHGRLLITGDSGPMHIGVAAGTPVLGIFGPSDPVIHCPPGVNVLYAGVACSPCGRKTCEDMTCMKRITVTGVLERAEDILDEKSRIDRDSQP